MSDGNKHHGESAIDEILSVPIPSDWLRTTIAQIGAVRLGRQRSPKNRSANHPTKYLRAANLTWTGLDLSDLLDMEFRPDELTTYRLHPGDVLLSEASGSPTEVGKPAIWNGEIEDCCFQNTVIRFRSKSVEPKFALIAFQHFARNNVFSRVSRGVGIHHLNADRFASMPFLLPPQNEQRRIVEKIEELFSDLEAGVAALTRARANLKRYRASVLKAAVEGSLTAEWRACQAHSPRGGEGRGEGFEPASQLLDRILTERRRQWEADQLTKFTAAGKQPPQNWQAKYVEPAPPDTSKLRALPDGWGWGSVEQLSTKVVDGVHKKPEYVSEGVPFITVRNLTAGPGISFERTQFVTEQDHTEFIKRANPQRGDILISKDGTLGVTRAVRTDREFSIFVSVALVKPVERTTSDFLEIAFTSPTVQRQMVGKGSGLQHIHLEDLRQDCIPLPSLAEQKEIVTEVAEKLSQIEAAEVAIDHSLRRAARLRQSILKQAFEGKLVPQHPTDEPASALLERIRREYNDREQTTAPTKRRGKA